MSLAWSSTDYLRLIWYLRSKTWDARTKSTVPLRYVDFCRINSTINLHLPHTSNKQNVEAKQLSKYSFNLSIGSRYCGLQTWTSVSCKALIWIRFASADSRPLVYLKMTCTAWSRWPWRRYSAEAPSCLCSVLRTFPAKSITTTKSRRDAR